MSLSYQPKVLIPNYRRVQPVCLDCVNGFEPRTSNIKPIFFFTFVQSRTTYEFILCSFLFSDNNNSVWKQRRSKSFVPPLPVLKQLIAKLSCYAITNRRINIVSKRLKGASDAHTHPPTLTHCPNLIRPSDYTYEWSNGRKDSPPPPPLDSPFFFIAFVVCVFFSTPVY